MTLLWFTICPLGKFGPSMFAFMTYNSLPIPITDFQVRPGGKIRTLSKTHNLGIEQVQWLLDSEPETLIISLGWHGVVKPRKGLQNLEGTNIRFLKTGKAIKLYNQLKNQGHKVAIHLHSTC